MKYLNDFCNRTVRVLLLTTALISYQYAVAQDDTDGAKTLSPYFVVLSNSPEVDMLPLKETSASVNIAGVIADVTVRQQYVNSGKNTLEAVYTFPMSTKAAVYAMKMIIGKRVIIAKIDEKNKARKNYEKAKSEGKRVSLLEQSRPNVFTMNVANIAVNDTIAVELKYTELLVPESGIYSFVYPTVVGPRYSNKNKQEASSNDDFVNSPYTKQGTMPAYRFGFTMTIRSGLPIQDVTCKTHRMNISYPALQSASLQLDSSETQGGNRDVIVNYSLRGNEIESGMMLYNGKDENFFLLMVQPPKKIFKDDILPREYIFIVDVSGSMYGYPLEISKKLLRNLITNLRPTDKFNVLLFSGSSGTFNPTSMDATPENVDKAVRFIDAQRGGGGTELLPALKKAFALPCPDLKMTRSFVIATDGYVDVEKEAFQFIRENSGNANFFSFGIGTSVNRYIIEGMAFAGNGEPMVISNREQAEAQAEKFRNYINSPLLSHIKVYYDGLQAYDVEPSSSPDMLAERPVIITGKYKGIPSGTVTVTGKAGKKNYKQTFDLSQVKPTDNYEAIRYLWARERIKLLDYYSNRERRDSDSTCIKEITQLGLKYNLMTNYTSFIAIDETKTIGKDGKSVTVRQPLPLPENVSDYAVGNDVVSLSNCEINNSVVEERRPEIFSHVEQMPQFPGGDAAVMKWLKENIVYPKVAQERGIQGRVIVRFWVEKDGSISDVEVIKSLDPALDKEAIRLIKNMPKWIPGKQNGNAVRTLYTLPIIFKLSGQIQVEELKMIKKE